MFASVPSSGETNDGVRALVRADLDSRGCPVDGCELECAGNDPDLVVQPRCHLGQPVFVIYKEGDLWLFCARCRMLVMRVEVSDPSETEEE